MLYKFLLAGGTVMVGTLAHAQIAQPATPPSPKEASRSDFPPGAAYLAKRYNLSQADALERIKLQEEISALAEKVASEADTFAGIWIQHKPVFVSSSA
jgi:hypothetical protein